MTSLYMILKLILDVAWFIMIAHIIMSWLISFQVLNLRQPIVAQLWYGVNKLLEPLYSRIRRFLPDMGGSIWPPPGGADRPSGDPHYSGK